MRRYKGDQVGRIADVSEPHIAYTAFMWVYVNNKWINETHMIYDDNQVDLPPIRMLEVFRVR